jgi:hypothetical protein
VNGWTAWRNANGVFLSDLREQFLEGQTTEVEVDALPGMANNSFNRSAE